MSVGDVMSATKSFDGFSSIAVYHFFTHTSRASASLLKIGYT